MIATGVIDSTIIAQGMHWSLYMACALWGFAQAWSLFSFGRELIYKGLIDSPGFKDAPNPFELFVKYQIFLILYLVLFFFPYDIRNDFVTELNRNSIEDTKSNEIIGDLLANNKKIYDRFENLTHPLF